VAVEWVGCLTGGGGFDKVPHCKGNAGYAFVIRSALAIRGGRASRAKHCGVLCARLVCAGWLLLYPGRVMVRYRRNLVPGDTYFFYGRGGGSAGRYFDRAY
jgi:hypothetical protein